MDCPEIVGERLQGRREPFISRDRICPHRVAAERRNDDAAQHRDFRVGVDKGHVGVPAVGATAAKSISRMAALPAFAGLVGWATRSPKRAAKRSCPASSRWP